MSRPNDIRVCFRCFSGRSGLSPQEIPPGARGNIVQSSVIPPPAGQAEGRCRDVEQVCACGCPPEEILGEAVWRQIRGDPGDADECHASDEEDEVLSHVSPLRRVEGGACCRLPFFPSHFAGPAVVSSVWGDVEVASAHGVVAFAARPVLRVSHHLARFLLSMPAWIASIRVEVRRSRSSLRVSIAQISWKEHPARPLNSLSVMRVPCAGWGWVGP